MRWWMVLAVTQAGCTGLSAFNDTARETGGDADVDADADGDADADADADADPIHIQSVDPAWGSNGGGTSVTIAGGPFDQTAKVYFVGAATKQGNVGIVSQSQITATVPASTDVGFVDVKVVTDTSSGTATSAFQYWADGSGKNGMIGGIEWYHYVGSYWNGTPTDFGDAFAFFVDPTTESYQTMFFSGALDQCASNYAGTLDRMNPTNIGAPAIKIDTPSGGNFRLTQSTLDSDGDGNADYPWYYSYPDSDGDGYRNDLRSAEYTQGGTYGLEAVNASGFPSFDLNDVAKTPSQGFQVNTPALGGTTVPTLPANIHLTWTGSGGDYMVATLNRFNAAGTQVAESVTCTMRDDGDFTVPNSVWTNYPSGVQVTILVGRVVEGGGTLPYDDANSGVVGTYWLIGAGFTQ